MQLTLEKTGKPFLKRQQHHELVLSFHNVKIFTSDIDRKEGLFLVMLFVLFSLENAFFLCSKNVCVEHWDQ